MITSSHTVLRASAAAAALAFAALAVAGDPDSEPSGNQQGRKQPVAKPLVLGTTLTLPVYGKYVWRGATFVDGPVFQPCLTLSAKGFSATLFGNYTDTENNNYSTPKRAAGRWTESDLLLDYSASRGGLSYSAGYNYYSQPNTGFKRSEEAYFAIGLAGPFAPRLTAYTGLDEYHGYYVSLGGTRHVATGLRRAASLDVAGSIGYGDAGHNGWLYGVRRTCPADLTLSASLPIALGRGVALSPSLSFSSLLDGRLAAANKRTQVWPGLAVSYSF